MLTRYEITKRKGKRCTYVVVFIFYYQPIDFNVMFNFFVLYFPPSFILFSHLDRCLEDSKLAGGSKM